MWSKVEGMVVVLVCAILFSSAGTQLIALFCSISVRALSGLLAN
jgi:hypothetical protein